MADVITRCLLEIVTFGVGFSLVFAVAQLCRRQRGLTDYLNFLVFLGNGVIQLFVVLVATQALAAHPRASFLFLTSLFLVGPANYLYHHRLLDPAGTVPTRIRLQFLPAAVAFAAELVFQLLPTDVQRAFVAGLVSAPLAHGFTLVLFTGTLFVFAYSLVPLRLGLAVLGREGTRPQVRVILAAFAATLVSILLISLGFVVVSAPLMLAGGALVTLINVLVFLATVRYPDFYRLVELEVRKARYERSMLKGLDTDALQARLDELMHGEALYKEFELSLESLAGKLAVTPHQLSQFLNERLDTNFRNYINSYRVGEAMKLLAGDAGRNISTVCYDVGFSSKSTFNTCFKKHTGQTPSEYRQQHCPGAERAR